MNHARYEEWLAVYDDLAPAERDELDRHLRGCASCTSRLAGYRALRRALQSESAPGPDGRLRGDVYAAIAQARAQDRQPRLEGVALALGNVAGWVTVAAIATLLVVGLSLTWGPLARQTWPADTVVPAATQPAAITAAPGATPTPSAATPLPTQVEPSVVRLERVQDLCCPPRFAPAGETYLTITSEGKLLLHTLSGGPAREVPIAPLDLDGARANWPIANAAWTPDGTAIVVSQGAAGPPAPVYLVDPTSGAARRLGDTYTPWRLIFDARGRLVLATETAYRLLDLATGNLADLPGVATRYTADLETELAFSPDGRSLAALEGAQLSIVDLSTGAKTSVTDRTHPQWRTALAWSSDGRQLAYATGARGGAPELWIVAADGSGARRLLVREGERDLGGAFAGLAWLPGTQYILYQFLPSGNAVTLQAEYQVLSTEGGAAKTLLRNGIGLNLSPDGRLISFTRDLAGGEETGNWVAVLEYAHRATPATPAPEATPTPIPVDGWIGTVVKLDPLAQFDDYFQRLDGERYGIDGSTAGLTAQIESARQQGTAIQVWGHLLTNVPDAYARQIVVERLNIVSVPAALATPTPTPIPLPPAITPVATGASIRVSGWSPDGQWLAFWMADTFDMAQANYPNPPATLHFYNVRSGQTCDCPELGTTQSYSLPLAWRDDGRVVVWDGETAKAGLPCQGGFQVSGEKAPADAAGLISPGGAHRVSTVYQWQDAPKLKVVSTFTEVKTGRPVQVVEYTSAGGDTPLLPTGPGGEWITDRLFLINYTLDRGPLLVDLAQGRIVEVGPEIFGLQWNPISGYRAVAQSTPGDGSYHIVLVASGVHLYHSETGQVEKLDFPYAWSPTFSPDGRWLLVDARPDRLDAGNLLKYESYALWARPVDPAGSPAHLVADGDYRTRWTADWTRVAMAGPGVFFGLANVTSVYSFPEGRLLRSWATGEYQARPDAWSPDGKRLVLSGNVPGEWRYGLFVVEP